jgi:hypothetical protein
VWENSEEGSIGKEVVLAYIKSGDLARSTDKNFDAFGHNLVSRLGIKSATV